MMNPSIKMSQMITKTQMTIPPIKVKNIKDKKSTRLMTPQKMKMKYRLQPMKQRSKNCLMHCQHKPNLRRQKNQNVVQDESQHQ